MRCRRCAMRWRSGATSRTKRACLRPRRARSPRTTRPPEETRRVRIATLVSPTIPASALDAIDAALEGLPADTGEAALAAAVTATLDRETQLFGITPEGVAVAVRRALDAAGSDHDAGGAV